MGANRTSPAARAMAPQRQQRRRYRHRDGFDVPMGSPDIHLHPDAAAKGAAHFNVLEKTPAPLLNRWLSVAKNGQPVVGTVGAPAHDGVPDEV